MRLLIRSCFILAIFIFQNRTFSQEKGPVYTVSIIKIGENLPIHGFLKGFKDSGIWISPDKFDTTGKYFIHFRKVHYLNVARSNKRGLAAALGMGAGAAAVAFLPWNIRSWQGAFNEFFQFMCVPFGFGLGMFVGEVFRTYNIDGQYENFNKARQRIKK